ncbi:MAG TPA: LysM peptidoglycan-binding domain-containing protein [Anaeromyxobacter sp.]|nr:LysM peptidoglycan-binding domain-containing protein [Anaeromyxobacter sp.]
MMRTPSLGLLALVAFVPLIALAAPQDPAPQPDAVAAPGVPGDAPIAPLDGAPGDSAPAAPPDTYTVRPGDTLWDLSGRFLNNPWYWPKIWSYNPEIPNPHWIYPGNQVRFFSSGDENAPMQVEPMQEELVAEEAPPEEVRELEDLARADLTKPASEEEKEAVTVAGARPIGYVKPRNTFASHDAFVTPRELDESGVIRASFEEKMMLSSRDRAYVSFRKTAGVKVGETYAIYRTVRKVTHPVTNEVIGFQSVILGQAQVTALDDRAVKIAITASYEPIERGDLVGPWVDRPYRAVPRKANAKMLRGYVVSSPVEMMSELAETQIVFVDKGKVHGVEEGNTFDVVRAGDPRDPDTDAGKGWDPRLPMEDVGTLLVVDVRERTSAALVTRSLRELRAGDRVEMRPAQ